MSYLCPHTKDRANIFSNHWAKVCSRLWDEEGGGCLQGLIYTLKPFKVYLYFASPLYIFYNLQRFPVFTDFHSSTWTCVSIQFSILVGLGPSFSPSFTVSQVGIGAATQHGEYGWIVKHKSSFLPAPVSVFPRLTAVPVTIYFRPCGSSPILTEALSFTFIKLEKAGNLMKKYYTFSHW